MPSIRAAAPKQLEWFQGSSEALSFRHGTRVDLDHGSWLEHHRGWLDSHVELFQELSMLSTWEQRTRWMFSKVVAEPRLTAEFRSLPEAPASLIRLAKVLSDHYDVDYDSAWLNLYRDQNDSTSWHADRPSCKREHCIVPVLSLGESRRFLIRAKDGGSSRPFVVEAGDLIVMGGRCQKDWVHSVPKESRPRGTRISVNFGSSFQAQADGKLSGPPPCSVSGH